MTALLLALGCSDWEPRSLEPYDNPFGPGDPLWSEQPWRDKPQELVVVGDRDFVSLPGTADEPGCELAIVDLGDGEVERLDTQGRNPIGLALHPEGRWLVVFNRFSNFASLVDTERDKVVDLLPMDFYATEGVFSPDGEALYVSNRWKDSVQTFSVELSRGGLELSLVNEQGVDTNPRDVAVDPSGEHVAVAALTGTSVSLLEASGAERHRVELGAPVADVAFVDGWLVAATLSASTHHSPHEGPDTDGDGQPGDGTPNINFQDLQSELAVIDPATGEVAWRATSDSLCCRDYRDVAPADLDRFGDLLPDQALWVLEGALPEQLLADGSGLWVAYSASDEIQRFELEDDGRLVSQGIWPTAGHNPHGLAVHGDELLVVQRLSESLGVYGVEGELREQVRVGSGGDFPATDAEIGELFNFVTAPFTVDGDGSCAACHREGGNIDKAFSMPLTRYPGVGSRMTMAYRGAADTRPWFFEAAFDETNFKPVMNELARVENFCCSDYGLWPQGAPADCASSPPPECETASNAWSLDGVTVASREGPGAEFAADRPTTQPTRDLFYLEQAERVIGRTESFGDGVFEQDPISLDTRPAELDFDGITRALGLFLLTDTNLLPNPNEADRDAVKRGQALFESLETGCASCHPAPGFALGGETGELQRMGPVVSPARAEDGTNLDLFAGGFVQTFPRAEQDLCEDICDEVLCDEDPGVCDDLRDVKFGVTSLRGIWDRAPSMLHDGRAQGLREVLCTPGHVALQEGEQGFNELDGIPDSHGGTSHLGPDEIHDLIAYLETL